MVALLRKQVCVKLWIVCLSKMSRWFGHQNFYLNAELAYIWHWAQLGDWKYVLGNANEKLCAIWIKLFISWSFHCTTIIRNSTNMTKITALHPLTFNRMFNIITSPSIVILDKWCTSHSSPQKRDINTYLIEWGLNKTQIQSSSQTSQVNGGDYM